jgi:hypothetical protein
MHAVDQLKSELRMKEELCIAVRGDIDIVKKDLVERKKDINQLILTMKDLGVGYLSDTNAKTITKYQPEHAPSEGTYSDREGKRDKVKKTSNDKSKKVNSPGKKIIIQLK